MEKERIFLRRDREAETQFESDYLSSLYRANKWIIPIMKKFGIPITLDSVIEYSVAKDLRKAVVDHLTRKALDGMDADLMRAIDINNREKDHYDEKIKELIRDFAEIETEKERKMILAKKDSDSDFFTIGGEKIRKYLSKEDILSLLSEKKIRHTNRIREEYEDISVTPEQNFNLHVSHSKLAQIRGLLILSRETLEFDNAKIQEKFTVYAEGGNEIKLVEKLKRLADLINEIYGKDFYNSSFAFDIFFNYDEKSGVKIKSDVEKKRLVEYSKNI
jgi:hypothetical protein